MIYVARSKTTGEDERFMFIIPQCKMGSEVTITLEKNSTDKSDWIDDFCPNCGEKTSKNMIVCNNCGFKLKK